ncbi:GOLPH3/VPS74 family protein [Cellulomonas sp. URHB0016]
MLLAEDVLLIFTDDTSGKTTLDGTRLGFVLAGAVLLDLAMLRRVDVTPPGHPVGKGRVVVVDRTPTGDALLDGAMVRIAERTPRRAKDVLGLIKKDLQTAVLDRLARAGILRQEAAKVMGIFPVTRWPAVDGSHESEIRAGVRDVVVSGRTPTDREAALVSLLLAVDKVPAAVGRTEVSHRELRSRAKTIAQGEFAGEAVRRAIADMNAAVAAAVAASTVAATNAGA